LALIWVAPSLAPSFPWPAVPGGGAYRLAITDDAPALAARVAREFGEQFFAIRHETDPPSLPLDEALDKALARESGLVVIADQSDNAGGGAPSRCGWLTDRFGVSWQITPRRYIEMMKSDDAAAVERVMAAFLPMDKLDIAALEKAFRDEKAETDPPGATRG